MKKDLLITTISSNYSWEEMRNWFSSIKKTSYSGDILVIAYNFTENNSFLQRVREEGVQVISPKTTYRGDLNENFLWHSGFADKNNAHELIHNVRLFHIWQYFKENSLENTYDRVIFTDGRDVVFQTNPSFWLDENMEKDIIFPSEGILYRNQEWNIRNALTNYGPYVYEYILKNSDVINVGTFAAKSSVFSDLCIVMYLMSYNTGVADQTSFNVLFNTLLKDRAQKADYNDGWCLQIGAFETTIGDISHIKNGVVCSKKDNTPYCLVHQYDRVPEYKKHFDSIL